RRGPVAARTAVPGPRDAALPPAGMVAARSARARAPGALRATLDTGLGLVPGADGRDGRRLGLTHRASGRWDDQSRRGAVGGVAGAAAERAAERHGERLRCGSRRARHV